MEANSLFLDPRLRLAVLAAAVVLLFSRLLSVVFWRHPSRTPPSPPRLPVIGNLHQLTRHPHRALRDLSLRYGPLMLLRLGSVPVLVASSPDVARLFLKTHDQIFSNRPKSLLFEKLLYGHRDVATAPYGEYWRQIKSVCVLHLLSNKKVRSFRRVREEEVAEALNRVERRLASSHSSNPEEVNLTEAFTALTNNVVCRAALGRRYEGDERLDKLLRKMVEILGTFSIGDYVPWLSWVNWVDCVGREAERMARAMDEFLESVVKEHEMREQDVRGDDGYRYEQWDFVDVLLWLQREKRLGVDLARVSLKAVILDVFAAGTDTTFTVLEWAMTELLRHPKIMTRLQKEIRTVAGSESYVSEDRLHDIPYLRAVIKETFRLHPPTPLLVPHESTQKITVGVYDIEAGTRVLVNVWAIGHDPALWGRDVEEFKPERFLGSEVDFKGQNFELIPFGAGRRSCPGIGFALAVEELALANFLHRFDWSLPHGAGDLDDYSTESTGLTVHRKFPLVASATLASD